MEECVWIKYFFEMFYIGDPADNFILDIQLIFHNSLMKLVTICKNTSTALVNQNQTEFSSHKWSKF